MSSSHQSTTMSLQQAKNNCRQSGHQIFDIFSIVANCFWKGVNVHNLSQRLWIMTLCLAHRARCRDIGKLQCSLIYITVKPQPSAANLYEKVNVAARCCSILATVKLWRRVSSVVEHSSTNPKVPGLIPGRVSYHGHGL